LKKADEIYDTVLRVFEIAKTKKIPSYEAADRLAEQRLESAPANRLERSRSAVRATPAVSSAVPDLDVSRTASSRG
jgi:hypothetical protein